MRMVLTLALILSSQLSFAQTAPARPAARPAAPAAARGGIAITVTNPMGATLPGVRVEVIGASDRSGDTNASGQINFPQMQAGTYRLRFSGEGVIAFEREVVLRAGQIADVDVALNPAPEPPEPPAPPPPPAPEPPPAPAVGPAGQPQAVSIIDLAERQAGEPGNPPRRETLVSCSGNTRATLVQLNQDQPERIYDSAEVTYYVVAGQGAVRIDGRDTALAAGSFVSVPRGTGHSLIRRGNRPLIIITTLSGAPCEEAR
jgi:mannose-6-phosphate isomerase-like protein (cupin superfamily)